MTDKIERCAIAADYGFQVQLGIDTTNPVGKRFDLQTESLRLAEEIEWTGGLRGTRERDTSRVRLGLRRVKGQLVLQPNAVEMSYLLPWILGGTPSGSGTVTYPVADALLAYYVTVDRISKVFTYNNCKVAKAEFECKQGEPLKLTIDVVASDETVANSGTFPVLSLDVATAAFMFFDVSLLINSVSYLSREFKLTIDNQLDEERFFSSHTLSLGNNAKDRIISLAMKLPYGDAVSAYATGGTGVALSAAFTNGGAALTFASSAIAFSTKSPEVEGREEIMLPIDGKLYSNGATPSLTTTLNVGP